MFYLVTIRTTVKNDESTSGGFISESSESVAWTRRKVATDELIGRHLKTLNCEDVKEGEGLDNIPNIAYWFDIPRDNMLRSEYKDLDRNPKYVTVEIGYYGFNNYRLTWENAVIFAAATGRTLVLPPEGLRFSPEIFFPTNELRKVVNVITTKEFLDKEAITMQLGIMPKREVYADMNPEAIQEYFESIAKQYPGGVPNFHLGKTPIVLPFKPGEQVVITDPRRKDQDDFNNWLDGRSIKQYTLGDDWFEAKLIHLKDSKNNRLLIPFYCLVRHSDHDKDMYYKRLVRDRLHIHDKFFCKAGQVIAMLREESTTGRFNTMHVRRGDLQYKEQHDRTAEELFLITANDFPDNSMLFIATDETDTSFFKIFQEHYNVKFLKDYEECAGLSEMPTKAWSQLDAIIASHGDIFYGTWLSTFTSYIIRMRGYLNHTAASSLYFDKDHMHRVEQQKYPTPTYWMSEWKIAWEDID